MSATARPLPLDLPGLIRRKRDGGTLSGDELRALVRGATDGSVPDYQLAALLMAIYFRGLDEAETDALCDAMVHSGAVLDLSDVPGPKADKHSTGGVGDKVSLPLAPLAAACGVVVPMVSGRALGHTGGTLDKLEAIPGYRTDVDARRFAAVLREAGWAIIGQTDELAPADRKLYALRDVTATVESIPLIASSILSKKLAEGIDALVLDVKVGAGAFMKTPERARELAATLCAIGRRAGKRVTAVLSDMEQPLGRAAGNAVEVAESVAVLRGDGPPDTVALTVALGAEMLVAAGVAADPDAGAERIRAAIASGAGLERWRRGVAALGGDPEVERLPRPAAARDLIAPRDGFVAALDAGQVGLAVLRLGAGRLRAGDPVDPAAGILLHRKVGDAVRAGEPLATLHTSRAETLELAEPLARAAYRLADAAPAPRPLIHEVLR